MSIEADRLREFFNHEVTDEAADRIDQMESYIDRLRVSLQSSAAMLSMLSKDQAVIEQIQSIDKLIKGN